MVSTNEELTQEEDEGQIPLKKDTLIGEKIAQGVFGYIIFSGVLVVVVIIIAFILTTPFPMAPSTTSTIPTTDPNAFRTAVPTPLPTPTGKIPPKFSRGDILTDEPVTAKTTFLYIVLDYTQYDDNYHTTFIYRNNDGSWGHWTLLSGDYYFRRQKFEEGMWVYGHINPDQVPCGALGNDPDSVIFCQDH